MFAGVVAARDALLTFMVGGPDSSFEQAKAILSKLGKNVVHCGASGTGQVCTHISVYCECILQCTHTMSLSLSTIFCHTYGHVKISYVRGV